MLCSKVSRLWEFAITFSKEQRNHKGITWNISKREAMVIKTVKSVFGGYKG